MSRSAHAKSHYRLRKLPRCSRCNIEFILVAARYSNPGQAVEEWECPKCKKAVPKELLKESDISPDDVFLHERALMEQKRDGKGLQRKRRVRRHRRHNK